MVLFFLGFLLAIGLLAYSSMQVADLHKKTEELAQNLKERYSQPLPSVGEIKQEPEKPA
jgi:hypothetical protein